MQIPHRKLLIALSCLVILTMSVHFSQYIFYAIKAVYYPFELFDAEGIVWQQAMLIPGPRMYGDINDYPFIVFHYPPLYHLLSRAISLTGCSPLLAGRAISLVAAVVTAATIATLTYRVAASDSGRFARLLGCATSGLAFFCFYPVVVTSTFMRVDMLAIAFSFLGLLCLTTSDLRSWRSCVGMAFFVLAVFTKQTSIAAPLAAILVVGFVAPKQAFKILAFGFLLGIIPSVILLLITNGGFFRHLILYNINRYDFNLVWEQISGQAPHIIFFVVALGGLIVWWRQFLASIKNSRIEAWRDALRHDAQARTMVMVTLYFGLSTLMLTGLGKSGATIAYFDEWAGILCIFIGYLVAAVMAPSSASGFLGGIQIRPAFTLLLPVLLIVQVWKLPVKGANGFLGREPTPRVLSTGRQNRSC